MRVQVNWIVIASPWWRHQMETFSALLAICAGNSPITGEFLAQRPVTRRFDVFFDQHLNKRLSEQSQGWWFETQLCSLWRHGNGVMACRRFGAKPFVDLFISWTLGPNFSESWIKFVTWSVYLKAMKMTRIYGMILKFYRLMYNKSVARYKSVRVCGVHTCVCARAHA